MIFFFTEMHTQSTWSLQSNLNFIITKHIILSLWSLTSTYKYLETDESNKKTLPDSAIWNSSDSHIHLLDKNVFILIVDHCCLSWLCTIAAVIFTWQDLPSGDSHLLCAGHQECRLTVKVHWEVPWPRARVCNNPSCSPLPLPFYHSSTSRLEVDGVYKAATLWSTSHWQNKA